VSRRKASEIPGAGRGDVRQLVDPAQNRLTRIFTMNYLLCHFSKLS
jgi:hypothetical protein